MIRTLYKHFIIIIALIVFLVFGLILYTRFYKSNRELFVTKPKLFIYWEQGWDDAPYICKMCLKSWEKYNTSDWNIIKLDRSSIEKYIDITKFVPNFWNVQSIVFRSDILRINLLKIYENSVWADATTFCTRPLNDWITKYDSFFAFSNPSTDRLIANWFLYSKRSNYIIDKFCEVYNAYWIDKVKPETYFQFHYMFNELYNSDSKFKKQWDNIDHISANIPHKLKFKERHQEHVPEALKQHIKTLQSPMYKLDHREKSSNLMEKSKNNVFYFLAHHHGLI